MTSTPTATSAPRRAKSASNGEYALAVGVWNGNSDNSLVSTPDRPLFSIEVSTFVWRGFLQDATEGWSINQFRQPEGLETARVDPWTGLRSQRGEKSVEEIYIAGTVPSDSVPDDARCGEAVIVTVGVESSHDDWMRYNNGWLKRAERGAGVRGGPENTRTAYFYNGLFNPYGRSWGPLVGGNGCASESPSESPSLDPCASGDPLASLDPAASVDPAARGWRASRARRRPSRRPRRPPRCRPTRRHPPKSRPRRPTEEPTPPPTEEPTPAADRAPDGAAGGHRPHPPRRRGSAASPRSAARRRGPRCQTLTRRALDTTVTPLPAKSDPHRR